MQSEPGTVRQERWASSMEYRSDFILGNLVAKRCSVLTDPEKRKLIWFCQDISNRQGLTVHPSCNQWPAALPFNSPETIRESGLNMLATETLARLQIQRTDTVHQEVKEWIQRLCLDPDQFACQVSPIEGKNLLPVLFEIMSDCSTAPLASVADTSIKRAVFDLLDYGLACRGLVLCEGTYRVGKSFCTQAWAMTHLGEARYVQLTSARDEESFYRQIARSIGVACSLTKKASEIRERVEMTLQEQQIMLVIDEAALALPQAIRTRALPERLCWILTALVNKGVPVALIASRDFSRIMDNLKRTLPIYGQEQFWGRLRRRVCLPDSLTETDLVGIVKLLAPEANHACHLLYAGLAMLASGHAATLESLVSLSRFIAQKEGEPLSYDHVQKAGAELVENFTPHYSKRKRNLAIVPPSIGESNAGPAPKDFAQSGTDPKKVVLFPPA